MFMHKLHQGFEKLPHHLSVYALFAFILFVLLAGVAVLAPLNGFDVQLLSLLRITDGSALQLFFMLITHIGDIVTMAVFCLLVIFYLLHQKRVHHVFFFIFTIGIGLLFRVLLKVSFHRTRPAFSLVETHSFSFPSGHTLLSVVFFLLFLYLFWDQLNKFFKGVVIVLPLLIGLSRVFLGAHWPTDVLASWSLGFFLFVACLGVHHAFFHDARTSSVLS